MVALARGLGAACQVSVARLRPAESDVRGMSSTRSKTVGAVGQVRGDADVGFCASVGWLAATPGSLWQLAAAAERRSRVEGRYSGSRCGQGVCGDCLASLTHRERLLASRMVVLALVQRLGVWGAPASPIWGILARELGPRRLLVRAACRSAGCLHVSGSSVFVSGVFVAE